MRFRLNSKGAYLISGVVLFCLVALAMLPLGDFWMRMAGSAVLAGGIWLYFFLYTTYARWGVRNGAFFSHSGLLFTGERHIPLEDVTAVRCVQTPLERPLGLCILTVYAAGSRVMLPCVEKEDAEALLLLWRGSEKN